MHRSRSSLARFDLAPLALAVALGLGAFAAQAQTTPAAPLDIAITAQPLAQALTELARQAKLTLMVPPALVASRTAPAVSGRLTPQQALDRLLAGSGLVATHEGNAVVVRAVAGTASLSTITVSEDRDIGLRADDAPMTTKGITPLIKTPMSVQVVPQALIDDRQANTLRDALETVSGVNAGSTSLHEDIIVRGFPLYDTYRNGVRTRRIGVTELANAERVDILKGPSSTQFGRGDMSGMFNVVTKKPLEERYLSLQQQVGSHGFFQTTLDATGPLGKDNGLFYRLNGSLEDARSFRDYAGNSRKFIAPSLSWRPNADTQVNIDLEVSRDKSPIDRGIVAYANRPADVPLNRNFGEDFTHYRNNETLLSIDASYRIAPTWTIRQKYFVQQGRGKGLEYLQQTESPDSVGMVRMARRIQQRDIDNQFYSLEFAGTPAWLGMKHDFSAGFDHNRYEGRFDFRYGELETIPNLFLPVTSHVPPATATQDTIFNRGHGTGFYVQDQIALSEKINLLLAGRYDRASVRTENPVGTEASRADDTKFSPRLGVVYTLAPGASVYASYTESFSDANSTASSKGQSFKPIEAKQYEIGFKAESENKDFFTTLAIYDLKKQNIVVPDPDDSTNSVQIGTARSRGLEWDVGGRLTRHLNLTASYSYTAAKVLRDTTGNEGNALYGVPRHMGKLFLRYDLQAGGVQGWSFGLGMVALSKQQGDTANSFQLPGYGRIDLMAAYKWRAGAARWTAQVNILNTGDKKYYLPSGSRDEIAVGKPRTLLASLRMEY